MISPHSLFAAVVIFGRPIPTSYHAARWDLSAEHRETVGGDKPHRNRLTVARDPDPSRAFAVEHCLARHSSYTA
jgi:hypothetical protein